MTPQDCQSALSDMIQHYNLTGPAVTSKVAVVYKACADMTANQFRDVCAELFREAGKYWPDNGSFWSVYRKLKSDGRWPVEEGDKCPECGSRSGHVATGGVWMIKADWRSMDPFPLTVSGAFCDGSRMCSADQSEGAKEWRRGYYATPGKGWTEVTMSKYWEELRAWRHERFLREDS